jgi:serpin B
MKKVSIIGLLLVLSISLVFANLTPLLGKDVQAVVQSNNQFAFDLYDELNTGEENVFFSPFSIFDALSMTYVGAKGETKSQMAKTLHITLSNEKLNFAFSNVMKEMSLSVASGCALNVANALWAQKDFRFLESFISTIKEYYNGNLYKVNFNDELKTKKEINDWVNDKTNGKIRKIIERIPPLTKLILTNAIYFNGEWKAAFSTSATKPTTFFVDKTHETKVPMMYQESKFDYMENSTLQAIKLPYGSGDLSMIILLSKDKYGLQDLENALNVTNFKRWVSQMKKREVKVFFPKFKVETDYQLKGILETLGMTDAFNDADFSGIDGATDLNISSVLHKAYVDVNEKGTEAAAVTAVIMTLKSSPYSKEPEIPVFRADHPFIFFIVDKTDTLDDLILFVGKVSRP